MHSTYPQPRSAKHYSMRPSILKLIDKSVSILTHPLLMGWLAVVVTLHCVYPYNYSAQKLAAGLFAAIAVITPIFIWWIMHLRRRLDSMWQPHQREQHIGAVVVSLTCYVVALSLFRRMGADFRINTMIASGCVLQLFSLITWHFATPNLHIATQGSLITYFTLLYLTLHVNLALPLVLFILLCGVVCSINLELQRQDARSVLINLLGGIAITTTIYILFLLQQ